MFFLVRLGVNYTSNIKIAVVALFAIVMSTSTMIAIAQTAEGHGVQAQLQSRFVRIQDEAFSAQTLNTGDQLDCDWKSTKSCK